MRNLQTGRDIEGVEIRQNNKEEKRMIARFLQTGGKIRQAPRTERDVDFENPRTMTRKEWR